MKLDEALKLAWVLCHQESWDEWGKGHLYIWQHVCMPEYVQLGHCHFMICSLAVLAVQAAFAGGMPPRRVVSFLLLASPNH